MADTSEQIKKGTLVSFRAKQVNFFCHISYRWSRTLSMARALCELQMELKSPLLGSPVCEANNCSASRNRVADIDQFLPKTPVGKEVKRRNGTRKDSSLSAISNAEVEKDVSVNIDCAEISGFHRLDKQGTSFHMRTDKNIYMPFDDSSTLAESAGVNLNLISDANSSEIAHDYSSNYIGNFPSPAELVSIDENILANRCKLGYRAKRIISLARTIVEGRIQPKQLEQACSRPSVSIYNKLADQLKEIEGFGPYTCANVLMCMGFYHVIPSDSETIRHIKQVCCFFPLLPRHRIVSCFEMLTINFEHRFTREILTFEQLDKMLK